MYEFRRQVEALKQFRGRGTELISVYITPGYAISDVTAKLRDEYGQASNIKSKTTQLNVQAALQKAMQYLKTLGHKPPANGIAIFCGNLSESEGKTDIRLYSVIPPQPLTTQFYRCDSTFVVEPLEELMGQTDCFGLVVMDGKEATVALLKGKTTKVLKKLHTTAHQKVMKGGQCLHEDTLVQKADGSIVPIREIAEGDGILSADLESKKTLTAQCSAVYSRSSNKAYELSFELPEISIKTTPEHLFFVISGKGYEEKPAEELDEGDALLNYDFTPRQIKHKRDYTPFPQEKFYDLTVPAAGNFIANRLVVHNSAARYDRLHTEGVEYYYKRIGEAMDAFVGLKNFKGVIVGGPGPAKEGFLRMAPFHHELKVIAVVDTGYTDEQGLRELLEKSSGVIAEQEAVKEKKLVDEFMKEVSTGGLATYGLAEIREALESGKASKLLVSEGLELHELETQCTQCGNTEKLITEEPTITAEPKLRCGKCGAHPKITADKDIVAELQEIAASRQIEVELVSRETHEGQQFFGTFHGLGVFLRYK